MEFCTFEMLILVAIIAFAMVAIVGIISFALCYMATVLHNDRKKDDTDNDRKKDDNI
jgi:hypothetical protein